MQAMERSAQAAVAVIVSAAVVGLVGLPFIFGSVPDATQSVVWLALAVLVCACLLLPTRVITKLLTQLLADLPERRGLKSEWTRHAATEVARLIVAAGYLLLLQAILRHPVVAVFGASAEPFVIEAAIAIFALLLLLVLLASIYRAARPLLEGLAWAGLDSLFATSSSEEAIKAADTIGPAVTTPTVVAPAGIDETLPRPAQVKG
jgi:hypothetical protein